MRVSLNWLQQLVPFDLGAAELAEKLTMAGFEVEGIEDRTTWADGVVVGRIVACEAHPEADKLKVCLVDIGNSQPETIVCGAPNARAGISVPVATPGTYLPAKDLTIVPAQKRGVISNGMLCSLEELGLARESEGIHVFEKDYPPGTDVRPLLGLDDTVLEVASTANRADALSMVGIAREVAALIGGVLHLPLADVPLVPGGALQVRLSEPKACPVYIATLFEDVAIGPSPDWLRVLIEKAGMRSINNVVDVTNYILLEWGQPLHAFDADRLPRGRLGVRFAQPGETLVTLDGNGRTLERTSLLVTAGDQPVALAGVMGGEATEVGAATHRVLLEAAIFDPATIRRSARVFNLRSEASARYERGVDSSALEQALDRATALLAEVAGAHAVAQVKDDYRSGEERVLTLRPLRLAQVLGSAVPDERIAGTLRDLGFDVQLGTEGFAVTVPGYRLRDVEREIDLIEEVARVVGFENFPPTLPPQADGGYLPLEDALLREIRQQCQGAGLTEVITYSLRPTEGIEYPVTLKNPLTADLAVLRTDMLDGLLATLQYNIGQKNLPFHAFEIGTVFLRDPEGILESERLAAILSGNPVSGDWQKKSGPFDWFAAKGVLEAVVRSWKLAVEYQADRQDPRLHPGRTASLWVNGERFGIFGQLHPQTVQKLDLPEETYFFELDLDLWIDRVRSQEVLFRPYSPYPAADRDLSFFARASLPVADCERLIVLHGEPLLESVQLIDEYLGTGVPEGRRSLAFRLVYRTDHTLTFDEVEAVHGRIRQALVDRYEVELRS